MKDASTNYEDKRLTIRQLDWRYYKKETLPKVDLIVASDIVFARELHDSLSSLLVDLLSVSTEKEPSAYIACTVRADGMVKGFLQVRFSLIGDYIHFYKMSHLTHNLIALI